ncbi:MAG: threonine--tRNA ligase [Candidatus Woesearchaeota archaeon]
MKKSSIVELEKLRHTTSHVLAQAVLELFPNVKLGIGPSIENGFYYDFDKKDGFSPEEIERIKKRMKEIIKKDLKIEKIEKNKEEAREILKDQPYKLELLEELEGSITFFKQGDFIDLCKGPHLNSTGEIKVFELMNVAGAYWRGDSKGQMLQRIYGIAFYSKEELDNYLNMIKEAEKRDHRKLGEQLDLFSFHIEGPGFPFWHPKGVVIYDELMKYWKKVHNKYGYVEVKTPMMLTEILWKKSGHIDNYKENMYFSEIDKKKYAIKPMNCPGGILIYKNRLHSYREFPLRVGELGYVHRHELSGVLQGLFRVRSFTQDDAHIYCTEEQVEDEVMKVINLIDEIYSKFGFDYHLELSTRPEKRVGSDKMWDMAEKDLMNVLKKSKKKYEINEGDGAFYGPKIDFHIKDSIGRSWQCATIQVDFALPERFNLEYDGKDGKKHRPVMIHRTALGSIERFIGILIEHYFGRLPLWLSPVQTKILTVTDRNLKSANKLVELMKEKGIRAELDDRSETISKKVRDAETEKVPYIITIGDKEDKAGTLAVRGKEGKTEFGVKIGVFIDKVLKEISERC